MEHLDAKHRAAEAARAIGDLDAFDPIPVTIDAAEWQRVAAGLVQRVRALEAFLHDAYGPRTAERDGLIASSHYFEPGVPVPAKRWLAVTGHDLARDRDGRWWVLEDNVRTPGLMVYGFVAREVVGLPPGEDPGPVLHRALRDASPLADPYVVLLQDADGTPESLHELGLLARRAGAAQVTAPDLTVAGGRLLHEGRPVDVVWHRTAEDRLRGDDGTPTALGEVLLAPLEAGTVTVVNAPGSGLADDKRTGAHVEALIRGLLGEEPILAAPPVPPTAEGAVLKSRTSAGGRGVEIDPAAPPAEPELHVVQARVDVAPEPVVLPSGSVEPRAADLRAHVLVTDAGARVVASVARHGAPDEDRVNVSQGGGVKAVRIG